MRWHVKRYDLDTTGTPKLRRLGVTVNTFANFDQAVEACDKLQAEDPTHFYAVVG